MVGGFKDRWFKDIWFKVVAGRLGCEEGKTKNMRIAVKTKCKQIIINKFIAKRNRFYALSNFTPFLRQFEEAPQGDRKPDFFKLTLAQV